MARRHAIADEFLKNGHSSAAAQPGQSMQAISSFKSAY
jgi:hypothetical protein